MARHYKTVSMKKKINPQKLGILMFGGAIFLSSINGLVGILFGDSIKSILCFILGSILCLIMIEYDKLFHTRRKK